MSCWTGWQCACSYIWMRETDKKLGTHTQKNIYIVISESAKCYEEYGNCGGGAGTLVGIFWKGWGVDNWAVTWMIRRNQSPEDLEEKQLGRGNSKGSTPEACLRDRKPPVSEGQSHGGWDEQGREGWALESLPGGPGGGVGFGLSTLASPEGLSARK